MKNILVKTSITIKEAMKILDETAEKCLLVAENNKLLGTLTDGDLRRSILSGAPFNDDITKSYNKKPTIIIENMYTRENVKLLLREKRLDLIPVVDEDNNIITYHTWTSLGDKKKSSNKLEKVKVVIMAGGKGTRLEPFTKVLPKPLVPVYEKPIIEHIIQRFTEFGVNEFHLTLNYKGRLLKAYFEELQPDYKIAYVDEKKPMGTAGSLQLLNGKFTDPFFVTNCDIIIKANYASLYKFHLNGGYDISLVASAKDYVIPYGTCELNSDGHLSHINEKPSYNFLINTGLYVLNPAILNLIPKNKFFHITHLIDEAKKNGKKVGVFPIDDDAWIDVGQWAEYQKVVNQL